MKFKIYDEEKLELLGQDLVNILIHEILDTGILTEFCSGIANIDYEDRVKALTLCGEEFDINKDTNYIIFHLVMFCTTLVKFNAHDYTMKKKFFGGYQKDVLKAFSFSKGLEIGLNTFKKNAKFTRIKQIIADKNTSAIKYSYGDCINKTFPYFYFEYNNVSLQELAMNFAENIAYIRKPGKPNIIVGTFYEKAKELIPFAHGILHSIFIE